MSGTGDVVRSRKAATFSLWNQSYNMGGSFAAVVRSLVYRVVARRKSAKFPRQLAACLCVDRHSDSCNLLFNEALLVRRRHLLRWADVFDQFVRGIQVTCTRGRSSIYHCHAHLIDLGAI